LFTNAFLLLLVNSCAQKISSKLATYGLNYDDNTFTIAGFIDDKCWKTCRPGGPSEDGIRAFTLIQEAFYNGWKSIHGLKWQTFDLPNGMTADIWGPLSLRRSDLWMLRQSNLNARLRHCQRFVPAIHQKCTYGDSIFPWNSHIRSNHKGQNLTDEQLQEDRGKNFHRMELWRNFKIISIC
jgi:hypothetical protein